MCVKGSKVFQTKAASTQPQPVLQQECKHCATTKGKLFSPDCLCKSCGFHQLTLAGKLTLVRYLLVFTSRKRDSQRKKEAEAQRGKTYYLVI